MRKYSLLIVTGILVVFVGLGLVSKQMAEQDFEEEEKELLPNFYISDLDSIQVALADIEFGENGLIVGIINSECDLCHSQVDEFYKRAHKLEGVKIILISYQDIEDIKIFSMNYPDAPFTFWKADFEMLNDQFEGLGSPQVRLYNSKREMIKKINGISRIVHLRKYFTS